MRLHHVVWAVLASGLLLCSAAFARPAPQAAIIEKSQVPFHASLAPHTDTVSPAGDRARFPNETQYLPPLQFSDNSRFKILVISDTHLLDDQTVPGNASNVSRASTEAVRAYIAEERPHFVVHLGDIVSGERADSSDDVRGAVRQILVPLVDAGVPFATSKGNHDNDLHSTHASITDMEHEFAPDLSYTRKAPTGVGGGDVGSDNYWLPVYAHHTDLSSAERARLPPALLLWFFDSRSGRRVVRHSESPSAPSIAINDDWVHASVGGWIEEETKRMARDWNDTLPPSLAFVHIPTHAHLTSQTEAPYGGHVGGVINETVKDRAPERLRYPGLNDDKPAATQGGERSDVPYAGQDRAFLDALLKGPAGQARILAIVSGHDHGNDWCAPGSEITAAGQIVPLCFAKHSGFGGYDEKQWNHGARVFDVRLTDLHPSRRARGKNQNGVRTYIRFLSGEKRYDTFLDDQWTQLGTDR